MIFKNEKKGNCGWLRVHDYIFQFLFKCNTDHSILISVAYLTLLRGKLWQYTTSTRTVVVGPMGLLQPFADGLKLFIKEIDSTKSNTNLFLFAPMIFLARPCELVNNALSINSVMQI